MNNVNYQVIKFRNLTKDEIEVRVQSVKSKITLLLYKDARVDMNILDETVGAEGWQCEYSEHKGILFCRIGILTENGWIWKEDAGSESNMDAEKGNASDAFKRAAFRWNIGRALYSSPKIEFWPQNKDGKILANVKDNKCYDNFYVEKIVYSADGKRIIALSVMNDTTKQRVFTYMAADYEAEKAKLDEMAKKGD